MIPKTLRDLLREPGRTSRYLAWRARQPRPPRLERPIFMIGCPRSGTSISVELFGTHPAVANWSEAGRLWDPVDYTNAEADHCWGADRATPADARRLHGWCEWYRCSEGRERFVNKHPRNSVRIDYLDAIFPDAVFIHVVRDGRAVVNSILTQIRRAPRRRNRPFGRFCKPPGWRELLREDLVEQTALQWREIVRYILARRTRLGDRYLELTYEEICASTRGSYKAMFEFAGLAAGEDVLAGIPEKLEDRNRPFSTLFPPHDLETIELVQGELLAELGYPV